MKLSLAWIFDHIDADWQTIDVNHLIAKFNQVTAEIEHFYPISYDLSVFYLAVQPTATSKNVRIPELGKEVAMPERAGTIDLIAPNATDICFLVKKTGDGFVWARLDDFGVDKDGLVPALDADEKDVQGAWREKFECKDIIIEVDNKSITHRPDMWGHRGFAREIAAFLELPFLPKEHFLTEHKQVFFDGVSTPTSSTPFVVENQAPESCNVFNGLYFTSIDNKASNIFVTSRLLKVGARPINGIVDLTNYVTHEWGQPVHAYDATKITDQKVVVRCARQDETMLLLDGNEITMVPEDLLVADAQKGMCLAGIKGGMNDSVAPRTTSVFFEAANFEPGVVRRSAMRHKTRTDSSARFEKTLDPNQAVEAVQRFISLLKQCNFNAEYADEIITVGKQVEALTIDVEHEFLEKRSGLTLSTDDVTTLLSRIEFDVQKKSGDSVVYYITVPTFRSSKDVKIKEDILEEVIRLHGFEKIPLELPGKATHPFNLKRTMRLRKVKQYLVHGARMTEQQNYAFCDEQALAELGLSIDEAIKIVNPVSENYHRLTTSLVPALLKNIKDNIVHHEKLRFFEAGRIWLKRAHDTSAHRMVEYEKEGVHEKRKISGVIFEKRNKVDFYEGKYCVMQLFNVLGFNEKLLTWEKISCPDEQWYMPHQSAHILYDGKVIGSAGKISPSMLTKLDALPESDAFIFDIDADFLALADIPTKTFNQFSRFQETYVDISMLAPLDRASAEFEKALLPLSPMIDSVELIDFFEKEAWADVRSLTFRIWISHQERTIDREEVEDIRQKAIQAAEKLGGELRA